MNAEIYQVWKKEVLLLDEEGNELILPKSEQIPQDFFKKGENILDHSYSSNPKFLEVLSVYLDVDLEIFEKKSKQKISIGKDDSVIKVNSSMETSKINDEMEEKTIKKVKTEKYTNKTKNKNIDMKNQNIYK